MNRAAREYGTGSGFSRRMVAILAGVCAVSLLVGLGLAVFQEELSVVRSSGTDSFSYSALGHHGYKVLLQKLGYTVITSRHESGGKTGWSGVLVIAEPDLVTEEYLRSTKFLDMCQEASSILVVLPKRRGNPDADRPGFLGSVTNLPRENSRLILDNLIIPDSPVRLGHSRDLNWNAGAWTARPFIDNIQLLPTGELEPLVACPEGILLGQLKKKRDWTDEEVCLGDLVILTDPDLLANHGLLKGNNARLAAKIIDYLGTDRSVVVFDETLHGHEVTPSVFRSFFRIPLVFVLLQVLLTVGAFLWLANGRFGAPRRAAPVMGRGLDFLIDNTAELLEFGGHGSFVLGRYYRAVVASVCRRLHLDPPGSSAAASTRLASITAVRSPGFEFEKMAVEVPTVALDSKARQREVLSLARAVHRWQQEMTHGL